MERAWKPNVEISPNCPRCGSSNTKFCYYNNYSLTQPRYFCKGCRRYWTKGGSLRNVPIGGGCRKNRRGKSIRLPSNNPTTASAYGAAAHHPFADSLSDGTMRGNNNNGNVSVDDPTSSSSGGSHIDLALVYANYLNQKPQSEKTGLDAGEEHNTAESDRQDRSLSNIKPVHHDSENIELIHGKELLGCEFISELFAETHLSNGTAPMCHHHGADSFSCNNGLITLCDGTGDEANYCELPPLPSEEGGPWLSNPDNLMINHSFQATELMPVLGPDVHQDPNMLIGTWREFNLSIEDTAFSRK